jgi:hypothetical protein
MTIKRTLLLIPIFLLLINCKKKHSELEFEKSVVYEIFPALMDSLHYDLRLYPPPPPKAIYDKQGKYIGIDTTGRSAIWKKKYDFYFSGTTSLSRIQFDSTKSFGILHSGMGCGKLCGSGVRVFIRKEKNKWIIDKIIVTEIS